MPTQMTMKEFQDRKERGKAENSKYRSTIHHDATRVIGFIIPTRFGAEVESVLCTCSRDIALTLRAMSLQTVIQTLGGIIARGLFLPRYPPFDPSSPSVCSLSMEHQENKYGDSSTEDEAGSQTTEDEVPERQAPAAPPPPPPAPAPAPSTTRERPHYELRHTMTGHTSSLSAVKFSPDGTLLASCGMSLLWQPFLVPAARSFSGSKR